MDRWTDAEWGRDRKFSSRDYLLIKKSGKKYMVVTYRDAMATKACFTSICVWGEKAGAHHH